MTRINDIVKEEEDKKNKMTLDKASSARIIKRSLWMNATKKSSNATNNKDNQDDDKDDLQQPKQKHVRFD
jgi:hypothetical protein